MKRLQADARTNNGQQATSKAHSGKLNIKQYWYKSLNHKVTTMLTFFACFLGAITGKGLQIFTYTRHSRPLSSEGSLAYHTDCDTGLPFIWWSSPRTSATRTCCRAYHSGGVTTCFHRLGLSRLGFEHSTLRMRGERLYKVQERNLWRYICMNVQLKNII